ncbi:MAG: deoxyhypusine synthase family protein [Candidatus Micrarchaeota archaeon]
MKKFSNLSFKRKASGKTNLPSVKGFDVSGKMTLAEYIGKMSGLGFQASELAKGITLLKEMKNNKTTIFLSFTSNIISSGLRELVAQLCREHAVQCIITSTGAIEEDYMKSKAPFFLGAFDVDDEQIKKNALNRIGNVLVPDKYYADFEQFNLKFLAELYTTSKVVSPSVYCKKLGEKITDKNSFLYWTAKNGIPVIVPGFVDGAIGDHVFFFNQDKKSGEKLIIDQAADLAYFYNIILTADKTGGLIIGGGIAKHHLIGAAILRNGLDYAVYVSTGTQYDGSLSGARPTEAVSWNKLKDKKKSAFIEAEATLVMPLLCLSLL